MQLGVSLILGAACAFGPQDASASDSKTASSSEIFETASGLVGEVMFDYLTAKENCLISVTSSSDAQAMNDMLHEGIRQRMGLPVDIREGTLLPLIGGTEAGLKELIETGQVRVDHENRTFSLPECS